MFKLNSPEHSLGLIILRAIIDQRVIPILFDTGANISVISDSFLTELGYRCMTREPMIIRGLNALSECSGVSMIPITIGMISQTVELHVIGIIIFPIILGLDNMKKFHLKMNEKYEIS